MAAGSIIIELLAKTASFVTDIDRSEKALKKFQKQAEDVGKKVGTAIGAGIVVAAAAFDQLVKSVADFKDLEETVGSTAEDIASLSIAAATAGVSMESITSATIKLTKGLVGVDDESKAVGAALKALGTNVEEFKRLDPVGQYEAVGQALGKFKDGAEKTAVAVALFGKAGAEQLKVFKALDEAGGRQVVLTQEQIDAADAYADAQAKQIAIFKQYAQVAALDVLPAINLLIAASSELIREFSGIDQAGKRLAGESPVKTFADSAVDAFAFVIDAGQGVARLFDALGKAIGARAAQAAAIMRGEFKAAAQIGRDAQEEIENILAAESFSQRIDRLRQAAASARRFDSLQNDPRELARRGRGPATLPTLQFEGAEKAEKAMKDKTTDAEKYLQSLREQANKIQELTAVETVYADVQSGRFKDAKAGQLETALYFAQQIDDAKKLTEENKKQVDEAEKLEQQWIRMREAGAQVFAETRTPAEQYSLELERLNLLLEQGAIKYDTYLRALQRAAEQFDESTIKQRELANSIDASLENNAANAFEDFITGAANAQTAFKRFAQSVIADLARIASQKLAQQIFGDKGDGSSIGSALARFFNSGGSNSGSGFGTGSNFGNQDYGAFLATGTNYVPHDGFRATLHKGEAVVPAKYNPAAGGGSGLQVQVINPPGMPLTSSESREETAPDGTRMLKIFMAAVADDINSGGQIARAQEQRYGSRPILPRRGR